MRSCRLMLGSIRTACNTPSRALTKLRSPGSAENECKGIARGPFKFQVSLKTNDLFYMLISIK